MLGTQTPKSVSQQGGFTVLFQGDSITDAGRDIFDSNDLGSGYPFMVAETFSSKHPLKSARFLNRGVSGNTVSELRARWQKDCLDLRPDIVTILIGINDVLGKFFWRNYEEGNFESDYRSILKQTQSVLHSKIVLMTPFMLHEDDNSVLMLDLNEKISTIRALSVEFGAKLVPLHSIFAEASKQKGAEYFSIDGVHPTRQGHALIAQVLFEALTPIL